MLKSVTCLAGGVGAARFLDGLQRVYPADRVTVIANTGDDLEYLGAYISPDIDIVAYTLAGIVDDEKGWGIKGDTYHLMEQLDRYAAETWFRVGDRDFATHLLRTAFLQQGYTLAEATEKIRTLLGVKVRILPMSSDRVATKLKTSAGVLDFQEYFVKRKFADKVEDVTYDGANKAAPADGVLKALSKAEAIIFCPSNPILSIGPILAIRGIRETLGEASGKVIAVSPIVGGRALKGPLDKIMRDFGLEVSPYGVASLYGGILDGFVVDEVDARLASRISSLGLKVEATKTVMATQEAKAALAQETIRFAETIKK